MARGSASRAAFTREPSKGPIGGLLRLHLGPRIELGGPRRRPWRSRPTGWTTLSRIVPALAARHHRSHRSLLPLQPRLPGPFCDLTWLLDINRFALPPGSDRVPLRPRECRHGGSAAVIPGTGSKRTATSSPGSPVYDARSGACAPIARRSRSSTARAPGPRSTLEIARLAAVACRLAYPGVALDVDAGEQSTAPPG